MIAKPDVASTVWFGEFAPRGFLLIGRNRSRPGPLQSMWRNLAAGFGSTFHLTRT